MPSRLFTCMPPESSRGIPADANYSAPMKALAAEIVRKLGKRLRWLSIEVRELTGVSAAALNLNSA